MREMSTLCSGCKGCSFSVWSDGEKFVELLPGMEVNGVGGEARGNSGGVAVDATRGVFLLPVGWTSYKPVKSGHMQSSKSVCTFKESAET